VGVTVDDEPVGVKALAFDTGGTVLDWYTGVRTALERAGTRREVSADWDGITREYRRRSLQIMLGAVGPKFSIDDVHRWVLEQLLTEHHLTALSPGDREEIWQSWHQLRAWPDVPAALIRLRRRYVVASFTILSTSLVIDVSRTNGLTWDALIACEMLGVYKTHPAAYRTAAGLLGLKPREIVMVACHNFDLLAARAEGYRSAFVRRPTEWGSTGPPDPTPDPAHDIVTDDVDQLATLLGT
jgi:2-haloacid dehalogenase